MSERRQLGLLLVGLVVLAGVGFVGAALFPEDCEQIERRGQLELALTDAADALPLSAADGAAVEGLADELGIGRWRGAVALPDQAEVHPSEFGFFVVTPSDYVVLRPAFGIASAGRDRTGLDVIPAGTSLALRAADGETGVVNGEYELDRCGTLPPDDEVLALDRGFAVVTDDPTPSVRTLSGEEAFPAPDAVAAHFSGDTVVLATADDLLLHDLRTGAVLDRRPAGPEQPWVAAAGPDLLLGADGARLLAVTVEERAFSPPSEVVLPLAEASLLGAVTTPAGLVALGRTVEGAAALASDRTAVPVAFPAAVTTQQLVGSADGHVGVVVEVEGRRALLVYGRDATA